jgi:hypothetical protein
VCESDSGYTCIFKIYTGSDFDPNPDPVNETEEQMGHCSKVVMGMLREMNALNKGHCISLTIITVPQSFFMSFIL